MIHGLPGRKPGEYLTHREADEATALIRGWHAKRQPFFLQVSHYAVHTPVQAIGEVAAKYEKDGKNAINAKYAAMVESVDDSTGRILATLKELGIDKDTLVIFTSDNGGLDDDGKPTENAPLRGGKGTPYEGGIRVPFLVRWPGVVPAGRVSTTPVSSIDIFPTALETAAVPLPGGRAIDGLSLVAHLKSGDRVGLDRDELLWHFPHYRCGIPPYSAIRKGDWKLIKFWDGSRELFDLSADPGEEKDLAADMADQAAELETILMRRLADGGAKLPRDNPEYVPNEKPAPRSVTTPWSPHPPRSRQSPRAGEGGGEDWSNWARTPSGEPPRKPLETGEFRAPWRRRMRGPKVRTGESMATRRHRISNNLAVFSVL